MNVDNLSLTTIATEYLSELEDAGAAPATLRLYRQTFCQLEKHVFSLADFNRERFLERVADAAPPGWKRSTLTAHLTRVASISNWCFRRGYTELRHHAPRHSRRPKMRDLPTDEEICLLISTLRSRAGTATPGRIRTRTQDLLITEVLIETGARISEVLAVGVDDLVRDQHGARLIIRGTKSEAAERAVVISAELAGELRAYRAQHHIARGRLFRSKTRRPLSAETFANWLKHYCLQLGIQCVVTPHVFRHRWILKQIEAGKSALEVMTRVGHEDVAMTVYYFNQVRRLMPWVEVSGDVAILERRTKFWKERR